jgi:5'(3')-deoxyribonucleotidase
MKEKKIRHHMPIALIDVDNTLCDFATPLYNELIQTHPDIPIVSEWHNWRFWKDHMEPKDFYNAVNVVQGDSRLWEVIEGASELLYRLRTQYLIIIASHRANTPQTHIQLMDWLYRNDLPYHQIYLSYDKTVLFPQVDFIVDDSPSILRKAAAYYGNNRCVFGLKFPWNKCIIDNENVWLVESLHHIMEF